MATSRPGGQRWRLGLDGADAASPVALAVAVAASLRERGVAVLVAQARDYWRPRALRLERGRDDPQAYAQDYLDVGAVDRELLGPAGPGGSGVVRPVFRDRASDRVARGGGVLLPVEAVVVLVGPLLLGRGLALDATVHLRLSAPALARRTPPLQAWTLPALAHYTRTVRPEAVADLVVAVDDPARPAVGGRAWPTGGDAAH